MIQSTSSAKERLQVLKDTLKVLEKRVSEAAALANNLCSLSQACSQTLFNIANLKDRINNNNRQEMLIYYAQQLWVFRYLGVLVMNLNHCSTIVISKPTK